MNYDVMVEPTNMRENDAILEHVAERDRDPGSLDSLPIRSSARREEFSKLFKSTIHLINLQKVGVS